VELAIAGAELELLEEQRVVVEGESVEDIELGLLIVRLMIIVGLEGIDIPASRR
jgi:hypothetical protein